MVEDRLKGACLEDLGPKVGGSRMKFPNLGFREGASWAGLDPEESMSWVSGLVVMEGGNGPLFWGVREG